MVYISIYIYVHAYSYYVIRQLFTNFKDLYAKLKMIPGSDGTPISLSFDEGVNVMHTSIYISANNRYSTRHVCTYLYTLMKMIPFKIIV